MLLIALDLSHLPVGEEAKGDLENHDGVDDHFEDVEGQGRAVIGEKGEDDRCEGESGHGEVEKDVVSLQVGSEKEMKDGVGGPVSAHRSPHLVRQKDR